MKRILWLLTFSCCFQFLFSFPYNMDSLYTVLRQGPDTARWSASVYLAEQYHFVERKPDSVHKYIYLYRDQLEDAGSWKKLAYLTGIEGKYWSRNAQMNGLDRAQDTVLNSYQRMARYARLGNDSVSLAGAYSGISAQYEQRQREDSSSFYGLEAIRVYEKLNHPRLTMAYLYYGNSFNRLGDTETALDYWKMAWNRFQKGKKAVWKEMGISLSICDAYGTAYERSGDQDMLDSCGKFLRICHDAAVRMGDPDALAWTANRFPRYHLLRGDFEMGLQASDSALVHIRDNWGAKGPYSRDLCKAYATRADLLLATDAVRNALATADSAVQMAIVIGEPNLSQLAYQSRYKANRAIGNASAALADLEMENAFQDSVREREKHARILALENQYRANKKELDNIRLSEELAFQRYKVSQSRTTILLITLASLLFIVLIFIFMRNKSSQEKQKRLEMEKRLLRAQINPHFFFNVLTSLQYMVLQQKPAPVVASQISRLARLMRQTLESSFAEFVPIEEEIESMRNYLELQKLRFEKDFDFEIRLDPTIDPQLRIPTMIAQPLLENALEHGIQKVEHKGMIDVHFEIKDAQLFLSVQDNGIGIDHEKNAESASEAQTHISRASQITRERLQLLSPKKQFLFQLRNLNTAVGSSGTEARLSLPFEAA